MAYQHSVKTQAFPSLYITDAIIKEQLQKEEITCQYKIEGDWKKKQRYANYAKEL